MCKNLHRTPSPVRHLRDDLGLPTVSQTLSPRRRRWTSLMLLCLMGVNPCSLKPEERRLLYQQINGEWFWSEMFGYRVSVQRVGVRILLAMLSTIYIWSTQQCQCFLHPVSLCQFLNSLIHWSIMIVSCDAAGCIRRQLYMTDIKENIFSKGGKKKKKTE